MAVRKSPPQVVEVDLEATAELPIIDFDAAQTLSVDALSEVGAATDVYSAPAVPAGVADLAESLREVEQRLERKIERVGTLEGDLAAVQQQMDDLRGQLVETRRTSAEREAALRLELATTAQNTSDLERRASGLATELTEARTQLQLQHSALTESQQQSEQRIRLQQQQERDLVELRRRSERLHEALSTAQGFRTYHEAILAEGMAAQHDVDARHAAELQKVHDESRQLRDELAAVQQAAATEVAALTQKLQAVDQVQQSTAAELSSSIERAEGLAAELAASRSTMEEVQQRLDALHAVEERARQGAAVFEEQQRQIAALQAEIEAAAERQRATDAQLRKADARVQRLESDAHASAAVLGNLQQNMQRLGRDDTGSRPGLQLAASASAGIGVLRVLIRQEGGSDVVYPLGRRTSIGRTSENDIQVDTTYISRHHAVLLSNPDHCIVEDLNSTNGVLVNGRRINRQILHDGDTVTVGKTEFKYQQRS
jgi:chromosome segregation ATPase